VIAAANRAKPIEESGLWIIIATMHQITAPAQMTNIATPHHFVFPSGSFFGMCRDDFIIIPPEHNILPLAVIY
jgi:hypothetical protein